MAKAANCLEIDATWKTINRVLEPAGGGTIQPSEIFGTITAPHEVYVINPEGVFDRGTRVFWTGARQVGITWRHDARDPIPLVQGPAAVAAPFLAEIGRPFRGIELVRHMAQHGVPSHVARQLLLVLEQHDVVWRPHEVDLAGVSLPLVGR